MRSFLFLLLAISFGAVSANNPGNGIPLVTLTCKLDNCSSMDSLTAFQFDGMGLKKIMTVYPEKDRTFRMQVPKSDSPVFYYIGTDDQKLKIVLLGTEESVTLTGPCYDVRKSSTDSPLNIAYDGALSRANQFKIDMGNIINEYRTVYQDEQKRKEVEQKMAVVDKRKTDYLDSLKKANVWIGKIVALDTYLSYQNRPDKAKYKDEIDYFAKEYFHYADLKDPVYNNIPVLFDMFRSYTEVMCMVGLSDDQQIKYFDGMLKNVPDNAPAYKFALGGIITGLINQKHPNLIEYGNRYVEKYKGEDINTTSRLAYQISQAKNAMVNIPAPEITMNNREDVATNLSSLRGKVVLIDFWASWCGPCRKENPNVVGLYQKYHDKGFEVFSVSLDRSKEPWLKAIQDDGLVWPNHVSDLKGWQNAAAQLYGVTSIPHTVLVGRDGKIIARQLRGEDLGNKLKSIFGE